MSDIEQLAREIKELVNTYLTTLDLRRNVEARLRQLESKGVKSKKIRHGISGLRSTLRHLTSHEESILKTIEVKLGQSLRVVEVNENIKLCPRFLVEQKVEANTGSYYAIDKLRDEDIEKLKRVLQESGSSITLDETPFRKDYPKVLIVLQRLHGEVEDVVSTLVNTARKFEFTELPIHIIVKKLRTRDIELVKKLLQTCIIDKDTLEYFYIPQRS